MCIIRKEDYEKLTKLNPNERVLNLNNPEDIQLIRDSLSAAKLEETMLRILDKVKQKEDQE